jgi:hypothetical protein
LQTLTANAVAKFGFLLKNYHTRAALCHALR